MVKTLSLAGITVLLFTSCQSKEEKLKLTLKQNLVKYIGDENFKNNGSVNIDDCRVLSVDTLNDREIDSVMLVKIRKQKAYYDSLADDKLKKGNLYNHLAYSYQKLNDTAEFNLAILNATDSHYMAGTFIDSSMALQKTDELIKSRIKNESGPRAFYQAKVFLRATFFNNSDSTKIHDTAYYHFNLDGQVIDLNKEINKLVKYDWE